MRHSLPPQLLLCLPPLSLTMLSLSALSTTSHPSSSSLFVLSTPSVSFPTIPLLFPSLLSPPSPSSTRPLSLRSLPHLSFLSFFLLLFLSSFSPCSSHFLPLLSVLYFSSSPPLFIISLSLPSLPLLSPCFRWLVSGTQGLATNAAWLVSPKAGMKMVTATMVVTPGGDLDLTSAHLEDVCVWKVCQLCCCDIRDSGFRMPICHLWWLMRTHT